MPIAPVWYTFAKRRDGMAFALSGGLWFHPHVWRGEPMAHLVSSDRGRLLEVGRALEMRSDWLQHKPLKHPETGRRVEAWHWDLRGPTLRIGRSLAKPWSRQELRPEIAERRSGLVT